MSELFELSNVMGVDFLYLLCCGWWVWCLCLSEVVSFSDESCKYAISGVKLGLCCFLLPLWLKLCLC